VHSRDLARLLSKVRLHRSYQKVGIANRAGLAVFMFAQTLARGINEGDEAPLVRQQESRKRNLAFSGEGRGFRGRGRPHRRGRAQAPSEKIVVPLPMARNGPKVRPKLEDDGISSRALPRRARSGDGE
jgi:hypothetical protein